VSLDSNSPALPTDRLETLFAMQKALNDRVFVKQNLRDHSGVVLSSERLLELGRSEEPKGPNTETNEWLGKYLNALEDESRELREELLWKWWSKDKLDMQNIRVEIVDQLHFWISLAMTAGMDAEDVFRIYEQKNLVNLQRQEQGYNKANKDETDNQHIA
jgi:dimeric dUTPase (all-alpha-NTP-PPase superfamily)